MNKANANLQGPHQWHVCAWDVSLPGSEGMVEVLDENSQLICRAKDRITANLIASLASRLRPPNKRRPEDLQ